MVTRVCKANDLSNTSMWQNGPYFLTRPIEEWPISKDVGNQELPDKNNVVMTTEISKNPGAGTRNMSGIVLENFNDFDKLITVTAMILKWYA